MHRRDDHVDHVGPMLGRLSASSSFVNWKFDLHCCQVSSWKPLLRSSEGYDGHLAMWARNPVGSFDRNQKSAARILTIFLFLLLQTSGLDTLETSAFAAAAAAAAVAAVQAAVQAAAAVVQAAAESRPSSFGNFARVGRARHFPMKGPCDRALGIDRVGRVRWPMIESSLNCYPIWAVDLPTYPAESVNLPVSSALEAWTSGRSGLC